MKIALGTVQWGMNYGISNQSGQVPLPECEHILQQAKRYGIDTLDTAIAYGNSESCIGRLNRYTDDFKIITKIPSLKNNLSFDIRTMFEHSLKRLKRNKIYALMTHDANDLLSSEANQLINQLLDLKNTKQVEKIGVSVYSPQQLLKICEIFLPDIVQIPFNIFDQRFLQSGLLTQLTKNNIEIHARSLFLQGLLLMDQQKMPDFFSPLTKNFSLLAQVTNSNSCSKLDVCLAFAKRFTAIKRVVLGVCNRQQLLEILYSYQYPKLDGIDFAEFACNNEKLINPALWNV